jgi:DNA repair protein RadA/Sms
MPKKCKSCGHELVMGKVRCPYCLKWNWPTTTVIGNDDGTMLLSEVKESEFRRIQTGPWDTCLGGVEDGQTGIVTTSTVLIGGEPGAGKSTLAIQIGDSIADIQNAEVLYVTAEETLPQLKNRFKRLRLKRPELIRGLSIVGIAQDYDFQGLVKRIKPKAIILDSISKIMGEDYRLGISICAALKVASIAINAPSIIICHVNKGGDLAGMKAMEHEVDSTHLLTGINRNPRYLQSLKNRFGLSYDLVFEMTDHEGLVLRKTITGDELEEDENEDT